MPHSRLSHLVCRGQAPVSGMSSGVLGHWLSQYTGLCYCLNFYFHVSSYAQFNRLKILLENHRFMQFPKVPQVKMHFCFLYFYTAFLIGLALISMQGSVHFYSFSSFHILKMANPRKWTVIMEALIHMWCQSIHKRLSVKTLTAVEILVVSFIENVILLVLKVNFLTEVTKAQIPLSYRFLVKCRKEKLTRLLLEFATVSVIQVSHQVQVKRSS